MPSASHRSWLGAPVLKGHGLLISPVAHADLDELATTCDRETFRFYSSGFAAGTPEEFVHTFGQTINDPTRLHFAVRCSETGAMIGSSGFYDVLPEHKRLELGCTWYHPSRRGTFVNPACKLLLLEYAFESLRCVRVQIKTDARNVHSQRAIAKLGAVFEGRLRHHLIMPDGYVRDTMMYSVTNAEWPAMKASLIERLGAHAG